MGSLDDAGLDLDTLAATAFRVFSLVVGQDPDGEVDPAWAAVARHMAAMAEAGDDDVTLSARQVGMMLRREFARAADPDLEDLAPFETLAPLLQNAWQGVARHLLNALTGEITRQLGRHEVGMAEFAKAGFVKSP